MSSKCKAGASSTLPTMRPFAIAKIESRDAVPVMKRCINGNCAGIGIEGLHEPPIFTRTGARDTSIGANNLKSNCDRDPTIRQSDRKLSPVNSIRFLGLPASAMEESPWER